MRLNSKHFYLLQRPKTQDTTEQSYKCELCKVPRQSTKFESVEKQDDFYGSKTNRVHSSLFCWWRTERALLMFVVQMCVWEVTWPKQTQLRPLQGLGRSFKNTQSFKLCWNTLTIWISQFAMIETFSVL